MRRIARILIGLASIMAFGVGAAPASLAAGPKNVTINIGVPTMAPPKGKDSATFTLKEPINDRGGNPPFITDNKGNTVANPKWTPTYQTYNVAVPKIDPIAQADLTDPKKLTAASKAKAEAFAAAIGTSIGNNNRVSVIPNPVMTQVVTGSMANPNFNPRLPPSIINPKFLPVYTPVQFYQVVVTNISQLNVKTNYTGENGDGVQFNPGSVNPGGSMSPGSMGSMMGYGTDASGVDAFGQQSFVEFGTDAYQAVLFPTIGETDAMILDQIALDLTDHGISALFEAGTDTLDLINALPDGQNLDWGWTDTTLSFDVELDSTIPEPSSFALLFGAMLPLVWLLLRRTTRRA